MCSIFLKFEAIRRLSVCCCLVIAAHHGGWGEARRAMTRGGLCVLLERRWEEASCVCGGRYGRSCPGVHRHIVHPVPVTDIRALLGQLPALTTHHRHPADGRCTHTPAPSTSTATTNSQLHRAAQPITTTTFTRVHNLIVEIYQTH